MTDQNLTYEISGQIGKSFQLYLIAHFPYCYSSPAFQLRLRHRLPRKSASQPVNEGIFFLLFFCDENYNISGVIIE